eukprot:Gb_11611 [translate_table: standard]
MEHVLQNKAKGVSRVGRKSHQTAGLGFVSLPSDHWSPVRIARLAKSQIHTHTIMPSAMDWSHLPEELVESLSSVDSSAKLKALRDVKNQIIGNKTKKLSYIKLGAVPRVVEILASETETPLLVQSAAIVGSFACGIEVGVKAVLDSGALPHLLRMLGNGDDQEGTLELFCYFCSSMPKCPSACSEIADGDLSPMGILDGYSYKPAHQVDCAVGIDCEYEATTQCKCYVVIGQSSDSEDVIGLRMAGCSRMVGVVEAGARSLKMIFQSALAPKNDMLQGQRMELFLALLNSANANVAEVAASVIARCCETNVQQHALFNAGALHSLVDLLGNSPKRREAFLDAITALVKNNAQISMKLICVKEGKALVTILKLVTNKSPRTRLLACMCLANVRRTCPSIYPQECDMRTSMLPVLVKLLDEPGQVGEEAPTALADLVANTEELQKLAYDINAIEKLCIFLHKGSLPSKHLQGVLLALAELCSRLEESRRKVLDLEARSPIAAALVHESVGVRIAACTCIKSISRSVKNLRSSLTDESMVFPLFKLLDDDSPAVQVAALSAISNVVLDFTPHKKIFFKCGGVRQLIQLVRSMEPMLRLNAVWALRNLMYLADMSVKERVMAELTVTTLTSLIHDTEEVVQEQALAFVRNLVYGSVESVQQVFVEDGRILSAVVRQLHISTGPEVCTQGLYVLSNVAAGNEYHKDEVMRFVAESVQEEHMLLIRFLQDVNNHQLRVAAVWCIMNLSYPDSPGVVARTERLRDVGILSQLQRMIDDPCLDVKDRVKTALEQFRAAGDYL